MQYPIEPNSELPRWMQVSQPARKLFTRIAGTPLASGPVLSQMEGHDAPYASPYLKELEGSGLVSSVRLGGVTDPAARCFVEAYGREFLRYSDRCWHDDGGRALLLERFPATEILPLAAMSINEMGRFREFQWSGVWPGMPLHGMRRVML